MKTLTRSSSRLFVTAEIRWREVSKKHMEEIKTELLSDPNSRSLRSILLVVPGQVVAGRELKTVQDLVDAEASHPGILNSLVYVCLYLPEWFTFCFNSSALFPRTSQGPLHLSDATFSQSEFVLP